MSTWLRRIWHLLNRPRYERALLDEMRDHRAAMHDPSRFGDTHRLLEQSRDAWGWNWLDDARQDLFVGMRSLMRAPWFTAVAVVILTFGIGLNLTFYQFVQAALLRPPAITSVESLARFVDMHPHGSRSTVPYPLAEFVKANNSVLAAVLVEEQAAIAWGQEAAETVRATFVSANWFDELGYGPLHGRMLSETVDTSGEIPSIVLGYTFWKNRLGGDPNVVGTTAYLDRKPVVIAGVARAEFPGMDFTVADVFIPITQREYIYPESNALRAWGGTDGVNMYGRFRDGVSPAVAREGLRAAMQAIAQTHPEVGRDHWLEPLLATRRFMRDDERTSVLIVMSLLAALTGLVLVVVAANLGNLVMSRAIGRVRELGVRMALGARRTRIVRQLVFESIPLATLGVAGSLAFAATVPTLIATQSSFPPYLEFSPDWRTIIVAVVLGGIALVVTGLIPAWKVAQEHLIDTIKNGGQQVSQSLDRAFMRKAMIAAQVAGSCVLLVVAGMMVRSIQRVADGNLGFDYDRVAVLEMPLARHGITPEVARSYWDAVKARALANPEVEQAAIVTAPPLGGRVFETNYRDTPGLRTLAQNVDPEYFDTMKVQLIAGRGFAVDEHGVVIVSRRLAIAMYGTPDVLGRGFPKSAPSETIVGVAADAHAIKVNANDVAELYRPLSVADFSEVFLVARARTDANLLLPILREAASLDSRVIPFVHAMREDFDSEMQGPRVAAALASSVGLLTLMLACLGIFGVVSFSVALRIKEIGIRIALGGRQSALLRVLVRSVVTPVGVGIVLGVGMAAAVGAALSAEPFFLEHVDAFAFAGGVAVLGLAAAIAALMPASAALKRNPVDALRQS